MKKEKIIACGVVLLLLFGMGLGYILGKKTYEEPIKKKDKHSNYSVEKYEGDTYYIYEKEYDGDYSLDIVNLGNYYDDDLEREEIDHLINNFEKQGIFTYKEYISYMNQWDIKAKFDDEKKNYLILSYAASGMPSVTVKLADVEYKSSEAIIYMYEKFDGLTTDITGYVLVIPVDKKISEYDVTSLYTKEEFKNIKKYGQREDPRWSSEDKPMIYIYPEKEMDVNIKLGYPDLLRTTYPKYNNGWNVRVLKDGTIKYNGREYYGLYWEGKDHEAKVEKDGFVVKGEDVSSFLEEKLSILGLSDREINEFIIYWLPKMEYNKYNYIRFETMEEINSYMPLYVTPTPDSVIRVIMNFKGLDEKIDVKEQILKTPTRTGYTVVEWGGSEIR